MTTPKSITDKGIHSLSALGQITNRINELEQNRVAWVEECREDGCSWRMIGVALGTSTQAAWEKYSNHERDWEVPTQSALQFDGQPETD